MVNSRAISVIGLILGHESPLVPLAALDLQQHEAREHAGEEWDAQVDENALGDRGHGNVHLHGFEPQPAGNRGQERSTQYDGEEQHLEDRVERHQAGGVLAVAVREIVPDNDHGDAAGQADQDEPGHILGLVAEKQHRQRKHQDGADHPVLNQRQDQYAAVLEDPPHLLVLHLRQRRIHHEDQPDGDGDGCRADGEAVEEGHYAGNEVPEAHARRHGGEDPQRQVAIQERKPGMG
jgi:hypothetical protein